jgi:hypothetical protein
MPTFSLLYSIPYIIFFVFLYVNIIPLQQGKAKSFIHNYYALLQLFFCITVLVFFIGFRGFIYTDWASYYKVFENCPPLWEGYEKIHEYLEAPPYNMEIGFLLFVILCKTASLNYFFFQFNLLFIDIFILYYFFKRVIPNYIALGFLFYILFSGFTIEINLLRNAKAIMLFLLSLEYLEKRKIIKYFVLNLIGVLFHVSSFLYLPLYFVLNKSVHRFFIITVFVIGNILFLLQMEWCKFVLLLISSYIPGKLGVLLKAYLKSDFYSSAFGISVGYVERFLTFIVIFCCSRRLLSKSKNNLIYINIYYIYIIIYLYFSEVMILLERIAVLFVFPYWILYPQIYALLSKKQKKIFLFILLFYGILKMGMAGKNIYALYDNVLLPHRSYNERLIIQNSYNIYQK